ncbi:MAG: S53 family peptidase, partial [Candidatus Dormibacteraeota bacterium]|nr:S53 family peptidase [Candidatus Dormibacteraeota bacterium]
EVNAAFSVIEEQYTLTQSGRTYFANNQAPTVASDVDAVQGLTNIGFVEKGKATDQAAPCVSALPSGMACEGGLEGYELRTIYNVGSTNIGTGQALAVNGDGDTQGPTADLHKYESDRGITAANEVKTVFINTDNDNCVATGVQPTTCDTSGEGEWALDSTSSTAMAPGVNTLYYFFPSALGNASGFQAWADYNSTANGPIPMQENASWGECEAYGSTFVPIADGSMVTYTNAFVDAAGKKKTQFVSAGDLGGGCLLTGVNGVTPGGPPQTQWPCSSPWVVCVGGTVIYSNGATDSTEQRANMGLSTCTPQTTVGSPLNNCYEIAWSHTGGGTSYILSAPSWQTSMPGTTLVGHCVVDPNGKTYTPPGPTCRGVPDVAAFSGDISVVVGVETNMDDGNGFNDVEGGTPQTSSGGPTAGTESEDGGTSLSDPLWEGMWADANSALGTGDSSWGFAAPALYAIGDNPTADSCAFFDVQKDETGTSFPYPAEPRSAVNPVGWDYVSGLGSPNVTCLEQELAAVPVNAPEAPSAVLFVLVAPVLVGGAALLRRRRRRAAS